MGDIANLSRPARSTIAVSREGSDRKGAVEKELSVNKT